MASNFDWLNRPTKDTVRTAIFGSRPRPLKSYLCLPGWDEQNQTGGICIQRGIEVGAITPETEVIGYERKPYEAARVRRYFRTNFQTYDITIRHDDLSNSKLRPNSIDFAFLDYNGVLTYPVVRWFNNTLVPSLMENATVAITVPFGRALGPLIRRAARALDGELEELRDVFQQEYALIPHPPCSGGMEDTAAGAMMVQLFVMKYLLRHRHNESTMRHIYHDGSHAPVMLFLFENIRPLATEESRVLAVLNLFGFEDEVEKGEGTMTSHLSRSKAAKKAHKTRAINVLAKKRHEAAVKAWRTRRAAAS